MKTKEILIEGFVQDIALKAFQARDFNDFTVFRIANDRGIYLPVKIVAPNQEKKIEISETQFNKAFMDCKFGPMDDPSWIRTQLKQKLFGQGE